MQGLFNVDVDSIRVILRRAITGFPGCLATLWRRRAGSRVGGNKGGPGLGVQPVRPVLLADSRRPWEYPNAFVAPRVPEGEVAVVARHAGIADLNIEVWLLKAEVAGRMLEVRDKNLWVRAGSVEIPYSNAGVVDGNVEVSDGKHAIGDPDIAIADRNVAVRDRQFSVADLKDALGDANDAVVDGNLAIGDIQLAVRDLEDALPDLKFAVADNKLPSPTPNFAHGWPDLPHRSAEGGTRGPSHVGSG